MPHVPSQYSVQCLLCIHFWHVLSLSHIHLVTWYLGWDDCYHLHGNYHGWRNLTQQEIPDAWPVQDCVVYLQCKSICYPWPMTGSQVMLFDIHRIARLQLQVFSEVLWLAGWRSVYIITVITCLASTVTEQTRTLTVFKLSCWLIGSTTCG